MPDDQNKQETFLPTGTEAEIYIRGKGAAPHTQEITKKYRTTPIGIYYQRTTEPNMVYFQPWQNIDYLKFRLAAPQEPEG